MPKRARETQLTQSGGNTKDPLPDPKKHKSDSKISEEEPVKKDQRSRLWCFTLNNYTEEDIKRILFTFRCDKYVLGFEEGKENKTPHIQGFVHFRSQRTWKSLKKKLPKSNFRKCDGTFRQNYAYCTKKDTQVREPITNISPEEGIGVTEMQKMKVRKKWSEMKLYPWQQEILNLQPDERLIHWYWSKAGNLGKSSFAKYLVVTKDAIVCEGSTKDVMHQIHKYQNPESGVGKCVCWVVRDVARDDRVYNYTLFEKIKNGLAFSGKYEGGVEIWNETVLVCFANEPPDQERMSEDRWRVHEVTSQ